MDSQFPGSAVEMLILEVIAQGPIMTVPLRQLVGMTDRKARSHFDRALQELQISLNIARSNRPGTRKVSRSASAAPLSQAPCLVMYTGTISYFSASAAAMICWAVMTETSCSTERLPNSTATRSLRRWAFILSPSGRVLGDRC